MTFKTKILQNKYWHLDHFMQEVDTKNILPWLGHVRKMEGKRSAERISHWNSTGRRL